MNKLFVAMALVIGVAFAANADVVYFNDFTTLDNLRASGAGDPYLCVQCEPPVEGVCADVVATGYASIYDEFARYVPGGAQDWRRKSMHLSLKWEGPEEGPMPTGWVGFWIRLYDGIWNAETLQYDYAGWSNYFAEVPVNLCWHNFGYDLEFPDNAGDYPGARSQVYAYRVDSTIWETAQTPYTFGIDHFRIDQVPEPTTMALLAIGCLLAIVRKRK